MSAFLYLKGVHKANRVCMYPLRELGVSPYWQIYCFCIDPFYWTVCVEVCYFPRCATDVLKHQLEFSKLYNSILNHVRSTIAAGLRRIYMSKSK